MAFGTLDSITLPYPSSFSESREVIGGYNTTLKGTKRRFIKAIKKQWKIGYDILDSSTYDEIIALYNSLETDGIQESQPYMVLMLEDSRFNVLSENVHMDISDRIMIPGTDLICSVEITLTQI